MKSFSVKQMEDTQAACIEADLAKERRAKRQAELDAILAKNIRPHSNRPEGYMAEGQPIAQPCCGSKKPIRRKAGSAS